MVSGGKYGRHACKHVYAWRSDETERGENGLHGATILTHDLFTNGILYLDLGFNLHGLDQEDLPLASMMASALLEMGTKNEDYVSLSQRIAKTTGGIHGAPALSPVTGSNTGLTRSNSRCSNDRSSETISRLLLSAELLRSSQFLPMRDMPNSRQAPLSE